jgi:hypothetical protein
VTLRNEMTNPELPTIEETATQALRTIGRALESDSVPS